MHVFSAKLEIIGINPFVFVPEEILEALILKGTERFIGRDKSESSDLNPPPKSETEEFLK